MQRLLPSSYIPGSSNRDSKETKPARLVKNNFAIPLSDFLDRKLNKSSAVPKTLQGKDRPPFSSPACLGIRNVFGPLNEANTEDPKELKCGMDKVVFEQIKLRGGGKCKDGCGSSHMKEPRKRKTSFQEDKQIHQKHVLRDNNQKCDHRLLNDKKQRTLFNHYGNGGGWWDNNKEGLDNDEVGTSDVWEGMGTITLGGLDWK